jgi:hypothetical protein
MSTDHAALSRFLSGDCTECGTPGYQRHLSAVGGCATCATEDPRRVNIPVRNKKIAAYDMVWPKPYDGPYLAPFRASGLTSAVPAKCYRMASGAMVHVKPDCRC